MGAFTDVNLCLIGNMRPPDSLHSYIPKKQYDIYAVGVQECDFVHVRGEPVWVLEESFSTLS